jgi:hypothetical protein
MKNLCHPGELLRENFGTEDVDIKIAEAVPGSAR